MSELQAGRYVADHFYGDERDERKNASSTDLQWHRYRARALIVGYRYFLANGNIFDRQEGSLPGQVARLWSGCPGMVSRHYSWIPGLFQCKDISG